MAGIIIISLVLSFAPIQQYKVTAYCSCKKCCYPYNDGYTTSGHEIKEGDRFVAAPPDIPFGALVIVPGYNNGKPVPVLDRGGSVRGNRIDVYFDNHQRAVNWGRKKIIITFLNFSFPPKPGV